MCKNKDRCPFQNCWFRHEKDNEQNDAQHKVTENILNIMKKLQKSLHKVVICA